MAFPAAPGYTNPGGTAPEGSAAAAAAAVLPPYIDLDLSKRGLVTSTNSGPDEDTRIIRTTLMKNVNGHLLLNDGSRDVPLRICISQGHGVLVTSHILDHLESLGQDLKPLSTQSNAFKWIQDVPERRRRGEAFGQSQQRGPLKASRRRKAFRIDFQVQGSGPPFGNFFGMRMYAGEAKCIPLRSGDTDMWIGITAADGSTQPWARYVAALDSPIRLEQVALRPPNGFLFHVTIDTGEHPAIAWMRGQEPKSFDELCREVYEEPEVTVPQLSEADRVASRAWLETRVREELRAQERQTRQDRDQAGQAQPDRGQALRQDEQRSRAARYQQQLQENRPIPISPFARQNPPQTASASMGAPPPPGTYGQLTDRDIQPEPTRMTSSMMGNLPPTEPPMTREQMIRRGGRNPFYYEPERERDLSQTTRSMGSLALTEPVGAQFAGGETGRPGGPQRRYTDRDSPDDADVLRDEAGHPPKAQKKGSRGEARPGQAPSRESQTTRIFSGPGSRSILNPPSPAPQSGDRGGNRDKKAKNVPKRTR